MLNFLLGAKKTLMIPKIYTRRIGNVNIFELTGVISQPWVTRIKEGMDQMLEDCPSGGLLFNLREVEKLDRLGVDAILKEASRPNKSGILGRNLSSYFVAEHMNPNRPIPIFEQGREAIEYFEKEFAESGKGLFAERREFPRINLALPLEFDFQNLNESFFFEAVITNLSEGGFYCYFLDSKTEELAHRVLNPFDLTLLDLKIGISANDWVEAKAKLTRTDEIPSELQGLAMEFYNLTPEDRRRIQAFVKKEGKSEGDHP